MYDQEKSDLAVVAGKSPNKARGSRRRRRQSQGAGTKGDADQQKARSRTQSRARVTPGAGLRTASA